MLSPTVLVYMTWSVALVTMSLILILWFASLFALPQVVGDGDSDGVGVDFWVPVVKDITRSNQTKPDKTKPDLIRPEQNRSDQNRTEQNRTEQTRPDQNGLTMDVDVCIIPAYHPMARSVSRLVGRSSQRASEWETHKSTSMVSPFWSGLICSGLVWSGLVWSGLVWSCLIWFGLILWYPLRPGLKNQHQHQHQHQHYLYHQPPAVERRAKRIIVLGAET